MKIIIRNGHVIDPDNGIDEVQDLYLADGKILAIGNTPDGYTADREIDATDHIVCPGLVDLSARLREPGQEHKATIASETAAAAAAGITTLCCPPDTNPIVDTPAVVRLIRQRAEQAGFARVQPLGAMTRQLDNTNLSEMAALKEAGCTGVSNVYPIKDSQLQRCAMEYAATHNLTVFITPEDAWLRNHGCAHEGIIATRLGLPGIPAAAETAAVARDLALVEQTGVQAHFCRLSTARAVRLIARAQYDGLPVTADVCAHQLFFTEMDIGEFDSNYHVLPPLRSQSDREGLRSGIQQNVLDAICSDHQPHEADAKQAPFSSTEPGISALETLLPLTLKMAEEESINLTEALRKVTSGPARVLSIEAGTLSKGAQADICIFDPNKIWTLKIDDMRSRGRNTPFDGWEFKGKVTHTLLNGRIVYEVSN